MKITTKTRQINKQTKNRKYTTEYLVQSVTLFNEAFNTDSTHKCVATLYSLFYKPSHHLGMSYD